MSRLLTILLSIAWLIGVPLLAAFIFYPAAARKGWFMDTSRATAAKIHRGMPIAEVEQIIGGPPGDYVFPEDIQWRFTSGNSWPNNMEWVTYDGKIVVTDGERGIGAGQDGKIEAWSTAKGTVDSVLWLPYAPSKANLGDFWVMVGGAFILALLSLWIVHNGLRWAKTQPPAKPAPWDDLKDLRLPF
jgi:hypothetical protein